MTGSTDTPTVVLVHGGFADASFWAPVIEDLQAHNVPVLALSHRTISTHLYRIFPKLGITARGELQAASSQVHS